MESYYVFILLSVCCCVVIGKPVESDWTKDDWSNDDWSNDNNISPFYSSENFDIGKEQTTRIASFLSKYGYTPTYTENKKKLRESIKDFQYFGGLVVTGEVDSSTEELMRKSRCGLKDPSVRGKRTGRGGRARRYAHQGSKWMKEVLTWRYEHNENGTNARRGLTENDVRYVMRKAMDLWESKTNIKFVESTTTDEPDVLVLFVSKRHVDPFPFDGPGGTLAHAFYPLNNRGLAGDVHFDDDEWFTIENSAGRKGRDLLWVATHELGHTLGLDHSMVRDAVMFPYYKGYVPDLELKYDDTVGIQTLYGGKKKEEKPKKEIPAHRICPRGKVTAIWDYQRDGNYMMVTEDQRLYTVSRENEGIMHPNINSKDYYRVPGRIDAAYQTNLGTTSNPLYDVIFTSRGYYYIFEGFYKRSGPHSFNLKDKDVTSPLNLNFPDTISQIDAVMKWWQNGKVYFFVGEKYWRYDEKKMALDHNYPRDIKEAWGIPLDRIDAAYSSADTKETYFTREDKIYQIDDSSRRIQLKEGYPKTMKDDVFYCEYV